MVVIAGPATGRDGLAIIKAADVEFRIATFATQIVYLGVMVGCAVEPLPYCQRSKSSAIREIHIHQKVSICIGTDKLALAVWTRAFAIHRDRRLEELDVDMTITVGG